jgi:hypothetical protein
LTLKPPPVQALIKDTKTGREELHLVLPIRLRRRI